ncbi:hypothetical protein KIW84_060611 [Lathyrus oleraceus]|uniref:Uncharacterized protein n=1 Tax=Pisum sativum TaxID=3888 RepID=A0A9D4W1T6_PEA|nr:hypothetical protein KIW84_060611 [Pisum sativum]
MKPSGLRAEAVKRWGVKLSHDQTYREKRKSMELVQEVGIEQLTHLRIYGQELLKSNPNSTVVIQYTDSNDDHVFEGNIGAYGGPIITLLEGIKHYITKRMTSQKELLHGYTGSICPKIHLVIEKNKKQAQGRSPT